MTPELLSATLVASFTAVLWIPIILNRLAEMGIWKALRNPEPDVRPHAPWAYRLGHAHRNAIENLAVFAPLAIAVHLLGLGNGLTATWSMLFLVARVAHAVIYALGIPLLRTVAFFVGFLAQAVLALRLLGPL
jgi:uncharacterized MAPEG superfamily protein